MIPEVGQVWQEYDIRVACESWERSDLWKKYLAHKNELIPFVSDGPSCFPRYVVCNGRTIDLYPAAAEHDLEYYIGGTEEERFVTDARLAINVVTRCGASCELAMTMFNGVRIGGSDLLNTTWRWGFGRR
jgi:hypothetical protein